ncbi:MAG: ATP-binding cassette domain-containing protein [Prevotella sp.]|nr:ATP-binding cassette domain-containing protein [Prevotella sp.]
MIEIKNLSYKYPGSNRYVFDDFSLTLCDNNIYGLLGKNGMGKSTLLYLISGMLRQKVGTVTIDGVDSHLGRPEMLSELFLVPEEFELPAMSLDTYVRMNEPFYPRFSRDVLNRCLTDFELPLTLNLKALSMGQKKKVYMSFAIAANTRVLLMDEPTNGLDIPSKSQFRKVIANNMSDDRMVIISTHQVHDVESLLDHILILDERHLLLNSSVSDICEKYTFDYRMPGTGSEDVIYAEPTIQGNAVIAHRKEGDNDTNINLELLFNAANKGLLK